MPFELLNAIVCALTLEPFAPVTFTGDGAAVTLADATTLLPAIVVKLTL
jgi:hypothetical protein